MKVYLSSRFARREELNGYREELESLGVEVTSRWLTEPTPELDDEAWRVLAEKDVEDVSRADALVLFTETAGEGSQRPRADSASPSGGRHVEFGVALGLGKTVIVVGEIENLFQRLRGVEVVASWSNARDRLVPVRPNSAMEPTAAPLRADADV